MFSISTSFKLALIAVSCASIQVVQAARIHVLTNAEIQEQMNKNPGKKAILFVHTSWCAPCKQMETFLDGVIAQFPDVLFFDIDGDKEKGIKSKYGVSCYPTIIFLDENGKVIETLQGGYSSAEGFAARIQEIFSGRTMRKVVTRAPQEAARKQPARTQPDAPCVGRTKSGKMTSRCKVTRR
jgi:thiol-disulfide isomerase/thioredoxin